VREAALGALGALKYTPARGLVALLLKNDPSERVRAAAAEALGQLSGSSAKAELTRALADADSMVRAAAAETLARVAEPSCGMALTPLIYDSDRWVRCAAIDALGVIGYSDAAKDLVRALDDEDSFVRDHARDALKAIGSKAVLDAVVTAYRNSQIPDPDGEIPELIEHIDRELRSHVTLRYPCRSPNERNDIDATT
jgi:HEAT repeat protein